MDIQPAVYRDQCRELRGSGERPLQVLQHIHELLCGLGDRKVFVMNDNELTDRKCLGKF